MNDQVVPDLSEIHRRLDNHDEQLNTHSQEIDDCKFSRNLVKKRLRNLENKYDELAKQIEEINVKIMDFNIFDAIKNKPSDGGSEINKQREQWEPKLGSNTDSYRKFEEKCLQQV